MASAHVLILPFPAQGHVIPLMELSHRLVDRGFKITFVNTEFNHSRIANALSESGGEIGGTIKLVSIPDGMGKDEDRNDLARLCESMLLTIPDGLERLIQNINVESDQAHRGITWMVADTSMAFACRVAKKMGIRTATFRAASSAQLALMMSIPRLIVEEILSEDGLPLKKETIKLSPDMPPMDTTHFSWNLATEPKRQKLIYQFIMDNCRATELAEFIVSNSFQELESATFAYMPNILPIGPLVADQKLDKPIGHFWAEDAPCMNWLDDQPSKSVIYVAFGSFTILNQQQFREIAIGLEQCGQPFLWVVRPDLIDASNEAYPEGFRDRIGNRGRIVDWSPQKKVLAHPSVACFVTHCGWNSTIEGVRNGVPLLCWPYFCDQFLNQSYICDVWKTGFKLNRDDSGVVSSEQIKLKVKELLGDEDLKARSLMLKESANSSVRVGGSSYVNMESFVNAMRE